MNLAGKDRLNVVRTIMEIIVLIILVILLIKVLFTLDKYEPYDKTSVSADTNKGFVALAYFGVDRTGDKTLISTERLDEQLRTLYEQGFVTITQDDILAYYEDGMPLPEKSLFLMFEDGRRDTAIFAQKILEKYNFKASVLTYAEKFEVDDPKFLSAGDLINLEKSTYWEMGTNGYRLFYINVFDRYDYYLGELSTLEYAMMLDCLGRDYNHYLMDYIRDKYRVPKESYRQMYARISADYEGMEREYTDNIGALPGLYTLMHSNTGQFGNNVRVSDTNAEWIFKLFDMNFNREGYSWNTTEDDRHNIYDLTRMQPQPYWYINHLIMKIKYDSGLNVEFVHGDEEEFRNWEIVKGALECKTEKLVLTSEPESDGAAVLKNYTFRDGQVDLVLTGNKLGTQTVYLRSDADMRNAVYIAVQDNVLRLGERNGGNDSELYSLDLQDFDGIVNPSVNEDMKAARLQELSALIRYADNVQEAAEYVKLSNEVSAWQTTSIVDGAEEYVPDIDVRETGNRALSIVLNGENLSVYVDGKLAVENLEVANVSEGQMGLGCRWGGYGWNQRNLADDVYDGVFEKLKISYLHDEGSVNNVIYDDLLHGFRKFRSMVSEKWKSLINWFIKYL